MPDPTPDLQTVLDRIEPLRNAEILTNLAGGPSSDSWLIAADDKQFVARIDKPLARLLGLDRHAELDVLQMVSSAAIGPEVIWAEPKNGILITSYIPGDAWSPGDIHDPLKLRALASTLRLLHSLPPQGPVFNPEKAASLYARAAGTDSAKRIANEVATLAVKHFAKTSQHALCHNDLVHNNIVGSGIGGEMVKLIDWEYAAMGDPMFDLAVVVRHHQLETELAEGFLDAYFQTADKNHFAKIEASCRLYDLLAALWYLSVLKQPGHGAPYEEELNRVMNRL
jgi:thiamine kinase